MPIRIRARNWLDETPKNERDRRLQAVEASVSEAHLRINKLENLVLALQARVIGEPVPEPEGDNNAG